VRLRKEWDPRSSKEGGGGGEFLKKEINLSPQILQISGKIKVNDNLRVVEEKKKEEASVKRKAIKGGGGLSWD